MHLPSLPKEYACNGQPANYRSYPEGSKERAKAFAIELRVQYKCFASSLGLWDATETIAFTEKPWAILGDDEETFFKKVIGKSRSEIRQNAIQAEKARQIAATVEAIAEHGEIGNGRSRPDKNENIRSTSDQYGTSQPYRIAKLKRDYPAIAERLQSGEFRSVREAERAAGLDVPPKLSRVRKLIRAYDRLTESEQSEFREAIC